MQFFFSTGNKSKISTECWSLNHSEGNFSWWFNLPGSLLPSSPKYAKSLVNNKVCSLQVLHANEDPVDYSDSGVCFHRTGSCLCRICRSTQLPHSSVSGLKSKIKFNDVLMITFLNKTSLLMKISLHRNKWPNLLGLLLKTQQEINKLTQ